VVINDIILPGYDGIILVVGRCMIDWFWREARAI